MTASTVVPRPAYGRAMSRLLGPLALLLVSCSSEPAPEPPSGNPVVIPTTGTIRGGITMLANAGAERVFEGTFDNAPPAEPCTREEVAKCKVRTCTGATTPTPGAPFDPGTITITSPSMGSGVLAIKDGYGRLVQPGDLKDGEDVRFVSSAGFDLTAKAPTRVALGTFGGCSFGSLAACTVADKAPTLTWASGVEGDYVTMTLSPTLDVYPRVILSCSFPAAGGIGKPPEAALAKLDRTAKQTLFVTLTRAPVVTGVSDRQTGVTASRWLSGSRITVQLVP